MATLPPYLRELQAEIGGYADEYGLERFTQVYELIDYQQMCEIAAYEGFPVRYPHWRFGMEYDRLMKSQTYGLSKIYELVINSDPCYGYLLEGNSLTDQKLVMSHVAGHNDFFRNNRFFSHTDRRMIDGMANHAARVRRWMDRHGVSDVERFIDVCHSLDNLIDPWVPYRENVPATQPGVPAEVQDPDSVGKLRSSKGYLEDYINPPEFLEEQRQRAEREREAARKVPPRPERDVLGFLMRHAPLENWEVDVLGIIREEAYYFLPQRQTKIMNEGWATYWHSKIMTTRALEDSEIIDYAQAASGVTAMGPTQLNPYKLGVELFRHIEWRWNSGRFGPEWEACDRQDERESWDKELGLGRDKIFEVRRLYNDVTFVDEFFTEEFCRREKFFTFSQNRRTGRYEIESKQFVEIKRKLVSQLTNFGQPFIYVVDANDHNRGELLLGHRHHGETGGDLNLKYARETLGALERIWRRPVSLLSVVDGKPKRFRIESGEISVTDEPAAFEV
jgi:stage V sporulation protein R